MTLIPLILESPNKIKKITSCLLSPKQYVVLASCGHIRRLGDTHDGMGFALLGGPDHVVAIDYVEEASKKKIIANLHKQCQGAPVIYLATDPDREGEAIAWHLMQVLGPHKEYYRIRFHSVTAKDILAALAAPTRLDLNLVWAQQTRQLMDKWIGFQVSPLCWKLNAKSAGRVQSPALKLLVLRQREIDHFQPETYHTLAATFEVALGKQNTIMHANVPLTSYNKLDNLRFADEAAAMTALRTIEQRCPSSTWVLVCHEAETATHPPPPYTTMTMLQDSHTHARLKPDRAMAILQKLYEAGHITYHRTDSVALSAEGVFGARAAVEKSHPHLLSAAPRNYLTRNLNAQEAHEAIRPTHFDLSTLPAAADPAAAKIYRLIYLRTLATQCQPCLHTQYTFTYTSPPAPQMATFRTTESFLKEPGWKNLYDDKKDKKDKQAVAPPVWMRQAATATATALTAARLDEFSLETKHTTPPPPYNSSSLIHTMEKLGIGRPSTYASIIAKLFANKYVFEDKKNQHLRPTPLAGTLVDFLEQHYHTHFMNLTYTQDMERQLDAIATGKQDWHTTIGTFLRQFPS